MEKEPKKMKWVRFRVEQSLYDMFKRAYSLDSPARSFAHFAQLSLEERTERILNENDQKRIHGRIQTAPTEGDES